MKTKKITLNEIRNLVKEIIKEQYNLESNEINQIMKGYLDAALWTQEEELKNQYIPGEIESWMDSGFDEEENELDKLIKITSNFNKKSIENFTKEDIEPNSLIKAYTDIKEFINLAGNGVNEAIQKNGYEQLGHDIWLTRNHHGAGFFDHSYENEESLMSAAHKLKEVDLYINDNMKLSFSNEHIFQ